MDISGYGLGLSGLVNKYDPKHEKRISKEIKNKENKGVKIVDVQTVTLNNILDKHNIRNVDGICYAIYARRFLREKQSRAARATKRDLVATQLNSSMSTVAQVRT